MRCWHSDGTADGTAVPVVTWDVKSTSSGKAKRPKCPSRNPCQSHECVFLSSFVLRFLDSSSNGLKVPLTAPTMANSSSTITFPRNGSVSPSLRFSVSPLVGFLQLHPHIDGDNDRYSDEVFHVVQAIRARLWWLFPSAVFCGVLELVGWSGRLWSSHNPFLQTPFIIQ
jgi:hypothetical protein